MIFHVLLPGYVAKTKGHFTTLAPEEKETMEGFFLCLLRKRHSTLDEV